MPRGIWIAGILAVLVAGAATAQPISSRDARGMMFSGKETRIEVVSHPKLPQDQAALLAQVAAGQQYYGAIAFSPDEGIMVEATVAAVNHHTIEAASAAAIADCNAKKKGAAACVVAVRILPAGFEPRPLTLSLGATEALKGDYGRSGTRALAISSSTGAFGVGSGEGAEAVAIGACGQPDCAVAVAD